MRRTFPEHVGIKGAMTINRGSARQKAHSSYLFQVEPSGKTADRYTTPELYAFVSRAEMGVTTRSAPTSSTSNAKSLRKRNTQMCRYSYSVTEENFRAAPKQ